MNPYTTQDKEVQEFADQVVRMWFDTCRTEATELNSDHARLVTTLGHTLTHEQLIGTVVLMGAIAVATIEGLTTAHGLTLDEGEAIWMEFLTRLNGDGKDG